MRSLISSILFFGFLLSYSLNILYASESPIGFLRKNLIKKGIKLCKTKETPLEDTDDESNQITIDLKNPKYRNGILTTEEGGVIKNRDIRIQARSIQYIRKMEKGRLVHRLEAEKDLMVQYGNRVYVGEELEYDFLTKTGTVYNGKTLASPWYLGGDEILLKADGTYKVRNVFLTTCENQDSSWDIRAEKARVAPQELLEAQKVRFRIFNFPTLWLPSFKVNLKKILSFPLIRYNLVWDKGSGPRGSIRYRIYSWKEFALFTRLDWRFNRGFGGALETEYYPKHGRTKFETKSYLATDVVPNNPKNKRRYRLQGAYHSYSPNGKNTADIVWDKYSDIFMPQDFKTDDFEINTAQRTDALLRHQEDRWIALFYARPRVHSFNTIKQEIPTFFMTPLPFYIPKSRAIFSNRTKASFLKYSYAKHLKPSLEDFHSWRLETIYHFYQPLYLSRFLLIPQVGATGIFYSHNQEGKNHQALGSLFYGFYSETLITGKSKHYHHILLPYINFQGWSRPTTAPDDHYIFSINDGFHRINQLRIGLKNQLFSFRHIKPIPSFSMDCYTYLFIFRDHIPDTIPKIYLDLDWNLRSFVFHTETAWNFSHQTLDFSNIRLGWTINEDIAFTVEFRYRSPYDWRKADHDNFIVDATRTEEDLKNSPLSDKRNTILSKMFFRLNPYWTCDIQTHHGWNRMKEPGYNEFHINLYNQLSTSWKLRISYQHTQRDDRVTAGITLDKSLLFPKNKIEIRRRGI